MIGGSRERQGVRYAALGVCEAKARYQHNTAPIQAEEDGAATKVRVTVTGNFPGSPAVLTFAFHLDGDRITRLEIGA